VRAETATRSLAWLKNPDNWQNWPVCPVVRRGGQKPDCGIVRAGDPRRTVYIINLFMLEAGVLDHQLEPVEKMHYPDFETMIADGWEVD
jgi:hypothetical protein